jgi:uncharacterized cofD-like protein
MEKMNRRVVVIGGGTGTSVLLSGLKHHFNDVAAVVTVADNGGGSGVLREDLGMLPPGDVRACLLALADIEPAMEKMMNHRFTQGRLKGQNCGNLLIAAMTEIYGDFGVAIEKLSSVLRVNGRVYPMTLKDVNLAACLSSGVKVYGESQIPLEAMKRGERIQRIWLEPEEVDAPAESVEAIASADCIILGPGSLYTSILPNLLVRELREAIARAKAPRVYVSNIMSQPGETDGFTVQDHVQVIRDHGGIGLMDFCLIHTGEVPAKALARYEEDGAHLISYRKGEGEQLHAWGIQPIAASFVEVSKGYIRHDAHAISREIQAILTHKR